MKIYSLIVQTLTMICLGAIVAKLYVPQANDIGVHLGAPTQLDIDAVRHGATPDQTAAIKELVRRIPLTRVHGDVSISEPVEVTGSVEITH